MLVSHIDSWTILVIWVSLFVGYGDSDGWAVSLWLSLTQYRVGSSYPFLLGIFVWYDKHEHNSIDIRVFFLFSFSLSLLWPFCRNYITVAWRRSPAGLDFVSLNAVYSDPDHIWFPYRLFLCPICRYPHNAPSLWI